MTVHAFPASPALPAFTGPVPSLDRPLELGFLSPHNALDRRTFSGTPFHAARALAARPDIRLRLIGQHRPPRRTDRLLRRSPPPIGFGAPDLDGLDIVVGMVATPLLERLGELRPELPYLHVTDATPAFLRDVYGWAVPGEADAAEARVAARAAVAVYSSEVLAGRAAADLGLRHLNADVLPFGVNLDTPPAAPCRKPPLEQLELLFVGLDWERKGGDIAVAALDALAAAGRRARLTVVGPCPERHRRHPSVRAVRFLDKNRPRDARRLSGLYGAAHLLLLPTRADCTPMVVAEAMAHATPVLASDTGGIAGQIGGAGAGRVIAPFSAPGDWADAIRGMTDDAAAYRLLSDAAFDRAAAHLTWAAWAEGIAGLARAALGERTAPPAAMKA